MLRLALTQVDILGITAPIGLQAMPRALGQLPSSAPTERTFVCRSHRRSLQEGTIFSASGTSGNAFPLQRAIAWHASAAIDMARTKGLLPDSFKAEDVVLKVREPSRLWGTQEQHRNMLH